MFEPDSTAALVLGGMMYACVVALLIGVALRKRPSAE